MMNEDYVNALISLIIIEIKYSEEAKWKEDIML